LLFENYGQEVGERDQYIVGPFNLKVGPYGCCAYGRRPLTHYISSITITIKCTDYKDEQGYNARLQNHTEHRYSVNKCTWALFIVLLKDDKLLKSMTEGGKLFQMTTTRSVKKWLWHSCDLHHFAWPCVDYL